MKKMVVGMVIAMALVIYFEQKAEAQPACYAWDIFPRHRFTLNVKKHSLLTTKKSVAATGHAAQTAYSVHGKGVGGCGDHTMVAVDGTVIVAKFTFTTTGQMGAHMGLRATASKGNGMMGGAEWCRSYEVDCTTWQTHQVPEEWQCQSRNEWDVYHGASKLTKVSVDTDPLCSFFQDGEVPDVDNGPRLPEPVGPVSDLPPVLAPGLQ